LAYRRCELVRVNGNQIGARFLKTVLKKKMGSPKDRRQLAESDH
jgi:hypothetical protein